MHTRKGNGQSGTSLLETLIATAICTTVMFGLAAMVSTATKQNKNMGSSMAQATTLAAQKLDQLMLLNFKYGGSSTDTDISTTTFDALLTAGGGLTTDTTSFVEYLDATGACLAGVDANGNCNTGSTANSPGLFFTRRWLIQDLNSGPTTKKQITVLVFSKSLGNSVYYNSSSPQATISCLKVAQ